MKNTINNNSQQREFWAGEFGDSYIERNKSLNSNNQLYKEQISVEQIFTEFFDNIDKRNKILELGCNIGLKLSLLHKMGFSNLYGVEINRKAFEIAQKNNPDITFYNSSIEDFDQNNETYDLVFTSVVLIHINPKILNSIVDKIINLTKKYIFGFEYYADKLEEVEYRGHSDTLWKQNYPLLFTKRSASIKTVKSRKFFYKNSNLCDIAYLLNKFDRY